MDARKRGLPGNPHFSVRPHLGRLTPFLLACTAYFLLWIPEDPPSWIGALVKCLPVLCLVVFLQTCPCGGNYSSLLQVALLCSALGDVLLIWPKAFVYGVFAFTAAQVLFVWAFGFRPLRLSLLLITILIGLPFYFLLLMHLSDDMVLPLTAYVLALTTMLWRGLVRGGSARWGALLFAISDSILSWDTFIQPLAHARLLVIATYYTAQFLISLSACQSHSLKTD